MGKLDKIWQVFYRLYVHYFAEEVKIMTVT